MKVTVYGGIDGVQVEGDINAIFTSIEGDTGISHMSLDAKRYGRGSEIILSLLPGYTYRVKDGDIWIDKPEAFADDEVGVDEPDCTESEFDQLRLRIEALEAKHATKFSYCHKPLSE